MTGFLSPLAGAGWQFFDNQGRVLAGGKLYTYAAGSTTPVATWTDYTQVVQNANPMILNSAGRPPNEIWLGTGTNNYKFVLTDANDNILGTWDNIGGIGAAGSSGGFSEWTVSGLVVTYVSPTQFTVPGNQLTLLPINRRVQYTVSSGTYYGYVSNVTYDGVNTTTVTVVADSVGFDPSLSAVNYSNLNSVNVSIPQQYVKQGDTINTGTINVTNLNATNLNSGNVNITGGTISGIAGFSVPDYLLKNQGIV